MLCQKWILCTGGGFKESIVVGGCGVLRWGFAVKYLVRSDSKKSQKILGFFCDLCYNFTFGGGPIKNPLTVDVATCFEEATGHWKVKSTPMLLFPCYCTACHYLFVSLTCTVMSGL